METWHKHETSWENKLENHQTLHNLSSFLAKYLELALIVESVKLTSPVPAVSKDPGSLNAI